MINVIGLGLIDSPDPEFCYFLLLVVPQEGSVSIGNGKVTGTFQYVATYLVHTNVKSQTIIYPNPNPNPKYNP